MKVRQLWFPGELEEVQDILLLDEEELDEDDWDEDDWDDEDEDEDEDDDDWDDDDDDWDDDDDDDDDLGGRRGGRPVWNRLTA
jgi:hypothetical protein